MVALLLASGADARLVMGRNKVSPVDMALKHDANHGVMKVFRCVLTSTDVRVYFDRPSLDRSSVRPSAGHISRPKKTLRIRRIVTDDFLMIQIHLYETDTPPADNRAPECAEPVARCALHSTQPSWDRCSRTEAFSRTARTSGGKEEGR